MRPEIVIDGYRDGLEGIAVEYWERFVVYLAIEVEDSNFKYAGEVNVGLELAGMGPKTRVIGGRRGGSHLNHRGHLHCNRFLAPHPTVIECIVEE